MAKLELAPGVVLARLGSAGALMHTRADVAAFLHPVAVRWFEEGEAPEARGREHYDRCVATWRAGGLLAGTPAVQGGAGAASVSPARGDLSTGALSMASSAGLPWPVLVIAMAPDCSFCRQLRIDLAANSVALARLDAAVVLVPSRGSSLRALGRRGGDVEGNARLRRAVAAVGRRAGRLGTPTAVLAGAGRAPVLVSGYPAVSTALITISGADPVAVVVEKPTQCSINVLSSAPVDTVVPARLPDGAGRIGIAARGAQAAEVAEVYRDPAAEGYLPPGLILERPKNMFLLFRGGEMLARTRTAVEMHMILARVQAGYAPAGDETALLTGCVRHEDGRAFLFPRSWQSPFVKHASRLARHGWQVAVDPFTMLRNDHGQPTLRLARPAPNGQGGHQVTSILAEPPESGQVTRARMLAHTLNALKRPASPAAVHGLANALRSVPLHAGSCEDTLAFLTTR